MYAWERTDFGELSRTGVRAMRRMAHTIELQISSVRTAIQSKKNMDEQDGQDEIRTLLMQNLSRTITSPHLCVLFYIHVLSCESCTSMFEPSNNATPILSPEYTEYTGRSISFIDPSFVPIHVHSWT